MVAKIDVLWCEIGNVNRTGRSMTWTMSKTAPVVDHRKIGTLAINTSAYPSACLVVIAVSYISFLSIIIGLNLFTKNFYRHCSLGQHRKERSNNLIIINKVFIYAILQGFYLGKLNIVA